MEFGSEMSLNWQPFILLSPTPGGSFSPRPSRHVQFSRCQAFRLGRNSERHFTAVQNDGGRYVIKTAAAGKQVRNGSGLPV